MIAEKLRDSFMSLANEYRISERWREHFNELFDEIDKTGAKPERKHTCPQECEWKSDSFDRIGVPLTEYCNNCGATRDWY